MFACLAVCEAVVRAIYRSFPLQNLGDSIPVRIIVRDAMFCHPFRYSDVRPLHYISYGVQILPERVAKGLFPFFQAILHLAEHALPELDIPGDSAAVELFLPADYILYGIN